MVLVLIVKVVAVMGKKRGENPKRRMIKRRRERETVSRKWLLERKMENQTIKDQKGKKYLLLRMNKREKGKEGLINLETKGGNKVRGLKERRKLSCKFGNFFFFYG